MGWGEMKKPASKDQLGSRRVTQLPPLAPEKLLRDIRSLIQTARRQVAQAVNAGLVLLYWNIGRRIKTDILKNKRAAYGEEIVSTLSAQLVPEYGQGFGRRNLFRMVRFAEAFADADIAGKDDRRS